jgi:hypothetical protein
MQLQVPEELLNKIASLSKAQWPQATEKRIAESVLFLSNYFIDHPSQETPWDDQRTLIAYLNYYLPLNFLRVLRVLQMGQQVGFFADTTRIIDYGSGPGTAALAVREFFPEMPLTLVEKSVRAQDMAREFLPDVKMVSLLPNHIASTETLLASYSLTETEEFPHWLEKFQNIILIEPSTQDDGRRLMQWRQTLIDRGYFIWAPCTHQGSCPLLNQSKTDWCHDRLIFKTWSRQQKIEQHLPFRNRTLTTSYLLASKRPFQLKDSLARVVGDRLKEKGKDRQLVCRGGDREFLTWMHKLKLKSQYERGDLIEIKKSTKTSNEIRLESDEDCRAIHDETLHPG